MSEFHSWWEKSVDKELERLLDADVIEPVEGEATPWVSPIHVVKKPRSDNIRICVDMRAPQIKQSSEKDT